MPTQFFTGGTDSYTVNSAGTYYLTFLAGNDTLTVNGGDATYASMGEDDDLVRLQAGFYEVYGESGEDRFEVWHGNGAADGGEDDDLFNVRGGSGHILAGREGNDRFNFYANASSVTVDGGIGNDDFFGYGWVISGNIYGQSENDYFVGFSNASGGVILHGGFGNDVYRYHAGTSAVFAENVGEGTDTVQVARGISYTLADNIENISVSGFSGSTLDSPTLTGNALNNTIIAHNNVDVLQGMDGNDRLFGKGENDWLYGGPGNDYLDGGNATDYLQGDAGNDTLQGRLGDDEMHGGTGDDTYYVDSLSDNVVENSGEGTDLVRVSVDNYTLQDNVENGIISGTADFWLWGNTLDNELIGNSGANVLIGMEGNDTIRGGAGNDELYGVDGNDIMQGGDGDDMLLGWYGVDTMTGGAGADTFWYNNPVVTESVPGAVDFVTDFEAGVDILDLSVIDANTTTVGDQAFVYNSTNAPAGTAADLWWTFDSGSGIFTWYGDVNGDSVADFEVDLYLTLGFIFTTDVVF